MYFLMPRQQFYMRNKLFLLLHNLVLYLIEEHILMNQTTFHEGLHYSMQIDLLLLDIMLPGEDGLTLCQRIRATSPMPIIMISARGKEADRVAGLDAGADDYLAKPFGRSELLARVRAVLRRAAMATPQQGAGCKWLSFAGWRRYM